MSWRRDPWRDHSPLTSAPTVYLHTPHQICPEYPQCPREERRCLNEVRGQGARVSENVRLSNGLLATDFSLGYIMKHHFRRKTKVAPIVAPLSIPVSAPDT